MPHTAANSSRDREHCFLVLGIWISSDLHIAARPWRSREEKASRTGSSRRVLTVIFRVV
jgi:hypothetical protein